jgi:hypothetical protein
MERGDAVRKVQSLLALADHDKTHETEATTARALADKLKSRYKLSEEDIEPVIQVDFSSTFAGFYGAEADWQQEINVETKAILLSIETLVDKIDKQKQPQARAKGLGILYKELRERVEGSTQVASFFGRAVKIHRDHALYHVYKVAKAESLERRRRQNKEYGWEHNEEYEEERAEHDGMFAVEMAQYPSNSKVAAAVVKRGGQAHRDAVERRVKEKGCVMCGSSEGFVWYRWVKGWCYAVHNHTEGDCAKRFKEKYEQ